VGNSTSYKKTNNSIVQEGKDTFNRANELFLLSEGERDAEERRNRSTRSDKTSAYAEEREEKRKKKKLDRLERQRSR
jgi:hypothetical protein